MGDVGSLSSFSGACPACRGGPGHASMAPSDGGASQGACSWPPSASTASPVLDGSQQGADIAVFLAAPGHQEPGQQGSTARRAAVQRGPQAHPGAAEAHQQSGSRDPGAHHFA